MDPPSISIDMKGPMSSAIMDLTILHPSKNHSGSARKMMRKATALLLGLAGVYLVHSGSDSNVYHLARYLCDDIYYKYGNDPYGRWTDLYKGATNYFSSELVRTIVPNEKANNVAFVVSFLECPEREAWEKAGHAQDAIDSDLFYDEITMLKWQLCEECGVVVIGDQEYNGTAIALFSEDAIECVGPDGELYDRVQVASDLGYNVEILGPVLREDEIQDPYLKEHVEADAGLKDLIRLHAYSMTQFPLVVLVESYTQILRPINDLVSSMYAPGGPPAAFTLDYPPQDVVPTGKNRGADLGFVALKPSLDVLVDMVHTYKTTVFDPVNGWGNSGIGGFPGAMGASGFLHYYYSITDTSALVLDKCLYMNGNELHLSNVDGSCRNGEMSCDSRGGQGGPCQNTDEYPFADIYVAKLVDSGCGKPLKCPANDHLPHGSLCHKFHNHWSNERLDLQVNFLRDFPESDRSGTFKLERYLGYCSGEGKEGYNKILKDGHTAAPTSPIQSQSTVFGIAPGSCNVACPVDQYLTQECTCSTNPCDACPEGTRCQEADMANNVPPMCIDCDCGFCTYSGDSCCTADGGDNTCKAETNTKECFLQNAFFPGYGGDGDSCQSIGMLASRPPSRCGCQSSSSDICSFDTAGRTDDEKCFITRADEFLDSNIIQMPAKDQDKATECRACMQDAVMTGCIMNVTYQEDVNAMQGCIGSVKGTEGFTRREHCAAACNKNEEVLPEVREAFFNKAVSAVPGAPLPEAEIIPEAEPAPGSPCENGHCDICDLACNNIEDGAINFVNGKNVQCCIGEKACFERQDFSNPLGGAGVDVLCCRGHQSCYKSYIDLPNEGACCLASKNPDPDFGGGMVCQEAHFIRKPAPNSPDASAPIIPIKCLNEKACYQADFEGAGPVDLCCEEDGLDGEGRQGSYIGEDTDTCYQLGNDEKTWESDKGNGPPYHSLKRQGPEAGSRVHCASNTKGSSAKGKNCYQADFAELKGDVSLCCEGGGNEDCKQVCDSSHGCTCKERTFKANSDWCTPLSPADHKQYGLDDSFWGEHDCSEKNNGGNS